MADKMDIGLNLNGTHVLVTGGAGFIGTSTVQAFLSTGAVVTALDINESKMTLSHPNLTWAKCDITSESGLESAFEDARQRTGKVVQCCIALASLDFSALPHHDSIVDMPLAQWRRTHQVNIEGTFLTARTWLRQVKAHAKPDTSNLSLIIVGSESGKYGERTNPDYSTGKAAVQVGLLQALTADTPRIHPSARVNAIAPGPVDTPQFKKECAENPDQLYADAQGTVPLKKPVPESAVAKGILFLASENFSAHVHGQLLDVASGKQGKVMWLPSEC